MKSFPVLYKKNVKGKIETWSVYINIFTKSGDPVVRVNYGEKDGKNITKDFKVKFGKNIGKKNETDKVQQALKEAQARFDKKLKEGYVMTEAKALAGELDKSIKGGILPMLAHKYQDYRDEVKFPVYVQPKLDGQRCIAIKQDGKVTLWTRTRKPILSCPHIIEQLEFMLIGTPDLVLDGELYHHDLKNDFEKLMSAVRKQYPSLESKHIQYHIYDCVDTSPFKVRRELLKKFLSMPKSHIRRVPTSLVRSEIGLDGVLDVFLFDGYEGLMIRDPESLYENKRSKGLLKYKKFFDAEFKLLGVSKGEDDVVMFHFKYEGRPFKATKTGNKKLNQEYLKHPEKYIGKMVTVKWQKISAAEKVPMFANALRFRDIYE